MEGSVPKQRINDLFVKYKYPILVVLAGLGLMLLPSPGEEAPASVCVEAVAEPSLPDRLEAILSQIEGAGQVRVLLTLEAGEQTIYQTDSRHSGQDRTDDTVLISGGSREEAGLVRQILEPTWRGAVILCQGADSPSVRLAIVEAVRCVTGLGADEISVLKMK
jgi:stage III sporulation protein AG